MLGGTSFDGMFAFAGKEFVPSNEISYDVIGGVWWGLDFLKIRELYPIKDDNSSYTMTFLRE